jgi:HemY protein
MRGLFWILALFAAAVGLSLVARYNDGYVLLFIAPTRIEMSLTLFAVLQVGAFVVLYFLIRAASYTLRLPDQVREFRERRRREAARHALFDALVGSYEGRFRRAEKAARLAFNTGDEQGLAALVAARAAHRLNQPAERDQWLARAREAAQGVGAKPLLHAALMTQAELLADERRDREALEVLDELNRNGARHIAAQRLALKSMTRAGAWAGALKTARQLEEHKAIHPAVLSRTIELACAGLFDTRDAPLLRERLKHLTRTERRMPQVARVAARALIDAGLAPEARELIEVALDDAWDDSLGELYADCFVAGSGSGQLERAEAWRARHGREAGLLLCLGRLCAAGGLWGKAREYLESSIAVRASRRAYRELGAVFDVTGRAEDANRNYRLAALAE